jgi:Protein of unknown function (DUF1592)/Protein of unknown function (DUF1588)/Protein of unknown function (DUF1595)
MTRAHAPWCLALLLLACGETTRRSDGEPRPEAPPDDSAGTAGSPGSAGAGSAGAPTACELPAGSLRRLSWSEVLTSARLLLGEGVVEAAAPELDEPTVAIPSTLIEGSFIGESTFAGVDYLANRLGEYVRDHFELTRCAPDDIDCVRAFVANLGERAFRRALTEEERAALLAPVEQAVALGEGATGAVHYGAYAVFSSPHFLYRTAFGEPTGQPGTSERRLTSNELASSLSFFLTGGPPDGDLLSAARAGALLEDDELSAQTERLLATPRSRDYLTRWVGEGLLALNAIDTIIIDAAVAPAWGPELRRAARVEMNALVSHSLWDAPLGELFTSRTSRLSSPLAAVYGVPFPPPGVAPDAEGFVDTLLPEARAGILTRTGWLTLTARPDQASVVGRGLRVMNLLCEPPPRFPELPPASDTEDPPDQSSWSSRQRAEYRMTKPDCRDCHAVFDPLGLALEDLDIIGQFRTVDSQGRPVDASTTLPAYAGGVRVTGARQLSEALPEASLARCVTQALLMEALEARDVPLCERDNLANERAETGDRAFPRLAKQVVLSRSFRLRRSF